MRMKSHFYRLIMRVVVKYSGMNTSVWRAASALGARRRVAARRGAQRDSTAPQIAPQLQ